MTPREAQTWLGQLLESMGFDASVSIIELDGQPALNIKTADQALLIGKKGENLRALQVLLNSVVRKDHPMAEFIAIDIAGYKQERIDRLQKIARDAARQAEETSRPVRLSPMSAFDRRQVHSFLSTYSDIITESEGDEPHRRIVVKKRAY
jgi:spoIIIJ-associated protein